MIDLKTAENIHIIVIEKFGGGKGIRDRGALESAIIRPYATFDKKDLYPSTVEKAAAIFESMIINHPFIDGNKRMAYVLLRLFLLSDNLDIVATQNEKYQFVLAASKGELRFPQIKDWLNLHVSKKQD